MKYYAVTEDPNELLHYGVKGMKWGQHIFGDKPKSAGFKRALGKLRASSGKSKLGSTQKRMNKNRSQQDIYYRKAAKREQENASLIARLNKSDNERKLYNQYNRELRLEQKTAKNLAKMQMYEKRAQAAMLKQQAKHLRKSLKADKHFDKILQEAREGRLRYGQLNEDQIQRIQNRLNMEASARKLGSTEKPSWRQQKRDARRAGKLKGITEGTAAAMTEVARAGTQYGINHLLNRMTMRTKAKQEGKNERIKNSQKNKKTRRDINQEIREEAYKTRVRDNGMTNPFERALHLPTAMSADYLSEKKNKEAQKKSLEAQNKIREDAYKKFVFGNAGKDSVDNMLSRLNDDDAYKRIFGKAPEKYDQPVTKKPLEAKEIIYKGTAAVRRKVSSATEKPRKKASSKMRDMTKDWRILGGSGKRIKG